MDQENVMATTNIETERNLQEQQPKSDNTKKYTKQEQAFLQFKVEAFKMEFTISCGVVYCIAMTIVCGIFAFNRSAFVAEKDQISDCYAIEQSHISIEFVTSGATNVSRNMQMVMMLGFIVHLLGVFADLSMVIRVRSLNRKFRIYALIAVSIYTFLFFGWLIMLHMVRYNTIGRVCAGEYLEIDTNQPLEQYAIRQGTVLRNIIIGVWLANGSIVALAVAADLIGRIYFKVKGDSINSTV